MSNPSISSDNLSDPGLKKKIDSLYDVATYRPLLTLSVIILSIFVAILEGIGLSFLVPIIEIANSSNPETQSSGAIQIFVNVYEFFNIPFNLEYVLIGAALILSTRYFTSFIVSWLKHQLRLGYMRNIQTAAYRNALNAQISYFDQQGSDNIINTIVTQARYTRELIGYLVLLVQQSSLCLMYVVVAFYVAPTLTLITVFLFGGVAYSLRKGLEPGYSVGDKVAEANELVQEAVQSGTQGIRDVKLFGLTEELFGDYSDAINSVVSSTITFRRNQEAIREFYRLGAAVAVFGLIYAAIKFASLSLASLGVFLFAMFRLAPRASQINDYVYKIEGNLPHLVRTREFIDNLQEYEEKIEGRNTPSQVENITFDGVSFSYNEETILRDISLEINMNDFVAFAGSSGSGKSTLVSLLARLYEPDSGEIFVNGIPIAEFNLKEWRSKIAFVRQNPYIFNDTLWYNLTLGNRQVSIDEVEQASKIAQVTEFIDSLPQGYDTILGDDGVRLSGGQRQRVAIARALLDEPSEILVFDEATSDLDSELEKKIQESIESMGGEKTLIVIAHRLSTIVNADKIYLLENGRIIESGSHEALLKSGGRYTEYYSNQTISI